MSKWTINKIVIVDLLLASVGLIGMQSFLSWGATYTIMAHANLYSSLTSMLVVTFRISTCRAVDKFELIGCCVAILGCIITSWDPSA